MSGETGLIGSSSSATDGESCASRVRGTGSTFSVRGGTLALIDSLELAIEERGCIEDGLVVVGFTTPPPIDGLLAWEAVLLVEVGAAILGLPAILSLDFVLESEVRAVVAGVLVRGVVVPELADEGAGFVGDFVGDYCLQVRQN